MIGVERGIGTATMTTSGRRSGVGGRGRAQRAIASVRSGDRGDRGDGVTRLALRTATTNVAGGAIGRNATTIALGATSRRARERTGTVVASRACRRRTMSLRRLRTARRPNTVCAGNWPSASWRPSKTLSPHLRRAISSSQDPLSRRRRTARPRHDRRRNARRARRRAAGNVRAVTMTATIARSVRIGGIATRTIDRGTTSGTGPGATVTMMSGGTSAGRDVMMTTAKTGIDRVGIATTRTETDARAVVTTTIARTGHIVIAVCRGSATRTAVGRGGRRSRMRTRTDRSSSPLHRQSRASRRVYLCRIGRRRRSTTSRPRRSPICAQSRRERPPSPPTTATRVRASVGPTSLVSPSPSRTRPRPDRPRWIATLRPTTTRAWT